MRSVTDLWRFRRLLWDLVVQDFRSRYAGSVVGVFWNVLQPAAQVLIFAVILARILGARLPDGVCIEPADDPYALSIYICAGLLPWIVLGETATRNATAFLAHSNLIKKVAFPHPLLVTYQVVSGVITLALMLALFVAVMVLTGHQIGWSILWLPVLLAIQGVFMYGIGLLLATLTAHFRDMPQIIGILLQLWFWMTPIAYPRDLVTKLLPVGWGPTFLRLNPLYHLTNLYQNVLYTQVVRFDVLPNTFVPVRDLFMLKCAVMAVVAVATAAAATLFYEKLRAELPDQI